MVCSNFLSDGSSYKTTPIQVLEWSLTSSVPTKNFLHVFIINKI